VNDFLIKAQLILVVQRSFKDYLCCDEIPNEEFLRLPKQPTNSISGMTRERDNKR
jgi:hypothetical protein